MKSVLHKNAINEKVLSFLDKNKVYIASFLVPFVIMLILYVIREVFPFGERAYMRMDFYHQYAPFMREFARKLKEGESLLFAFENGMGVNYWAQYAYYLASPVNWIYFFVPLSMIVEVMNFSLIVRCGLSGLAFSIYLGKKYEKTDLRMVGFSAFYALSAYYLAYSCNIMWTDCYALFPIVILGVDELVKGKAGKWYGIAMAICTISNFYIAVILGFCLLCYLPISLCSQKGIGMKQIFKALFRFAGITIVCVMCAAVIMLPVWLALQRAPAGASAFPDTWKSNFNWIELIQRLLINMEGVLNKSKLPNIYSTVLLFLAFPMYIGIKSIPVKEKIARIAVMIFVLFSFQWNVLDYIWHAFHFPNSFPARQAFFFVFLAVDMVYLVYEKRKEIHEMAILIIGVLEMVLLAVGWVFWGSSMEYKGTHIYLISICFILLYTFLLYIENEKNSRIIAFVMVGICLMECCTNTFVTGIASTVKRENYVKQDVVIEAILDEIEIQEEDNFYRVEKIDRKAVNDGAWDGFNSISIFSSTVLDDMRFFFKDLGLRYSNGAYSYSGATPFTNMLFGVKYLIGENDKLPGAAYESKEFTKDGETLYLFKNKQALPLGFLVDPSLEARYLVPEERNPFLVHNEFASAVLDETVELFVPFHVSLREKEEGKTAGVINVAAGELVFVFIKNADAIEVSERNIDTGEVSTYEVDGLDYRQNVSFAITDYAREIEIISKDKEYDVLNMLTYSMKQEILDRVFEVLSANPMVIHKMSETHIEASVVANEKAMLLMNVPYDDGWRVWVDGEKVDTHSWENAFLSFEVEGGDHEIEMRYLPPGFITGLLISLTGISVAAFLLFYKKKNLKK